MLWYYAPALFIFLHSVNSFPVGKSTEKPAVPEMANPKQRRPAHISEFTDPDTGRNPFLDLEEGRAPTNRNGMEDDERPDDEPYFDIDPVEGDAPDRKRVMEDPVEHVRGLAGWFSKGYKDDNDLPVLTTRPPPISATPPPPTPVEGTVMTAKDAKEVESSREVEQKDMKGEKESFLVSPSTVIYATATLAVMTVVILLVGACWWRRKLKSSRSTTTVESSAAKS